MCHGPDQDSNQTDRCGLRAPSPASDVWGRCLGESSDIPGGERRLPPAQAAGMAPVKAGPAPESVQDLGLAPAAPVGAEYPPKVWGRQGSRWRGESADWCKRQTLKLQNLTRPDCLPIAFIFRDHEVQRILFSKYRNYRDRPQYTKWKRAAPGCGSSRALVSTLVCTSFHRWDPGAVG